jgi:3',5'-cyclic AMP phosphodiesterase CpdA
MTSIAQISDLHVTAENERVVGAVDSCRALDDTIAALRYLAKDIDVLVGTGDLAEKGEPAEYDNLLRRLGVVDLPFVPVMGNHDRRNSFRAAFGDRLRNPGPAPFVQYVYDAGHLRIAVLDTVEEGRR